MAGSIAPPRRSDEDESEEDVRARMAVKGKLKHQSRTSLTPEQQRQALEDAFGDDPSHRIEDKPKDKPPKPAPAAEEPAAPPTRRQRFTAGAKRTAKVSGTVRDVTGGGGLRIDDASGFVFALLGWSWFVLPFIRQDPTTGKMAGTDGVKNMLRAKFFNKDANGQAIP